MDFNPEKLEVNFMPPATSTSPIKNRKYTLTHSDETAMMFLDVGTNYNLDAINKDFRDDVLGKWTLLDNNTYMLFFYVNAETSEFSSAQKKYSIYKSHLDSALTAIFYGDRDFLKEYPNLVNTPICVKFDSNFLQFNNYEYYGFVRDYII